MERKILEIKMKDRIQNTGLRRSGMEDAGSRAHLTKWRWGGHIEWTGKDGHTPRQAGTRSLVSTETQVGAAVQDGGGSALDHDGEGQRKVERNNQLIKVLVKVPPVAERQDKGFI
jgi:hypothetical protein